jgi:3-mercaptopyruvate sulfurtransferase SseA
VDTRPPESFFGIAKILIVAPEGRIPQSVNLPSAWIFTRERAADANAPMIKYSWK